MRLKALLLAVLAAGTTCLALIECPTEIDFGGPGNVYLSTRLLSAGIDAPITTPDGQCAGTAGIVAQLFRVDGETLIPLGQAVSFHSAPPLECYTEAVVVTVPNTRIGETVPV